MTDRRTKADYPGAFIPFDQQAGQKPASAIDDPPLVQMCINQDWLPYVITCLKTLGRPETWDDTYDNAVIAASEVATLISSIADGCGANLPSKLCISGSFSDLDYGFQVIPGSQCSPSWVAGSGWHMCCNSTPQGFLQLRRVFDAATIIHGIKLTFAVTVPYLVDYDIQLVNGSTFTSIASGSAVSGPTISVDVSGLNDPAEELWIHVQETFAGCAADVVLQDFTICYEGAFPLSVAPPSTFVHLFDFGVGTQQGWYIDSGSGHFVTDHWESTQVGSNNQLRVDLNISSALTITEIECVYSVTNDKGGTGSLWRAFDGTTLVAGDTVSNGDTVSFRHFAAVVAWTGKTVIVFGCDANGTTNRVKLHSVTIHGLGLDPF